MQGHMDLVQFLLQAQADPGALDKDEKTPLHFAQQKGHARIVELLRSPSASPRASEVVPRDQLIPEKTIASADSSPSKKSPPREKAKPEAVASSSPKTAKKEKRGKKKRSTDKPFTVPDGTELVWSKPPPPSEVAEAMKFVKPVKRKSMEPNAGKEDGTPSSDPNTPPPSLVSCPFCRGQFVNVSDHMDNCPVIVGGSS